MYIGNRLFDIQNHTYIMGILNITPDSFSDGGVYEQKSHALTRVKQMIEEGASIIDVGGESTRPGHTPISVDEEIQRTAPIIELIKSEFDIPVSIDTYKSQVAKAAMEAGAVFVNDIWGFLYDSNMAKLVKEKDCTCCIMHNRNNTDYGDLMVDIQEDFKKQIRLACDAGIQDDKIIIDPGIGFGKTYEQNIKVMNHLEVLHSFGYPILLGTSRKSMIGKALDLLVDQRLEGTLATTVIGVMKGCSFIRVHDVKENYRAVKMTEAIIRGV